MMEYFCTIVSILILLGIAFWVFVLCIAMAMAGREDERRQFLLDKIFKKHYNKREGL